MRHSSRLHEIHGQRVSQEFEHAIICGKPVGPGFFDGLRDQVTVGRRRAGGCQIGAIHRKMKDVELKRLPEAVRGIIAGRVMSDGNPREQPRQHREFACQQGLDHAAFCLFQYRFEIGRLITDLPPGFTERFKSLAVDQ